MGLTSPLWGRVTHRDLILSLLLGVVLVPNLFGLFAGLLIPIVTGVPSAAAGQGTTLLIAGFAQEITLILLAVRLVRRRLMLPVVHRPGNGDADELADWIGLGDPPALTYIIKGIGLGLLLLFAESVGSGLVYAGLAAMFGPERAMDMLEGSQVQMVNWMAATSGSWQQYGLVLLLVAAGPLAEEIWFRGVFYPAWRTRWGVHRAIVAQSAVFGLLHLNWFAYPALFVVGAMLTLIYERQRSLWPAVFAHATLNAMVIIGIVLQRGWLQS